MRKGLTATLMTVAVALLAVQAMAMAPVIGEIPSPIVGDDTKVTGVTGFIFPDALNINSFVSDDATSAGGILWTYSIEGTAKYAINGAPLLGADDPVVPPEAKVFNHQLDPAENASAFVDKDPATITVRNINFTPLTGTGATPSGSGLLTSEIQAVTLYASDGETESHKSIFFYTDAGGNDALSPAGPQPQFQWRDDFTDGATRSSYSFQNLNGITTSNASNTAICLNSPMVGNNMGLYFSAYGKISLVQQKVYRLRAVLSGSNATAGSTPFWDVVVDNTNTDGSLGYNAYGADFMFLDNMGGGESVITTPKTFDMYVCPPAVSTARWNDTSVASGAGSSLFSTGNSANKDGRVIFRVLDVNSNPGILADTKSGSICLTQLTCDSFDIASFTTVADSGNFAPASLSASNCVITNFAGFSSAAFNSGGATFVPNGVTSLAQLAPGNADISTPAERQDNWPVPWGDQTLYKITVSMNGGTNPPGVFWIGADAASTEILGQSYSTNKGWGAGMPQAAPSQDFVFFFYSNFLSPNADASYQRLRPWLLIGGNPAFAGGADSSGTVNVTGMSMVKVVKPNS